MLFLLFSCLTTGKAVQQLGYDGRSPEEVVAVGDNSDSEIEAKNRLGMRTVQILREGTLRGSNATHYIRDLSEVKGFIE